MQFKIVIPARFGSSRLLGKPLMDICGKPMLWHTYHRALETNIGNNNIVIATDHQQTFDVMNGFGANVVMTSERHESGTSRLAEVADLMRWNNDEVIVNLQGDEPLLDSYFITLIAQSLYEDSRAGIATLGCKISCKSDLMNPNIVKVVSNINGRALYFSRSPIPFSRSGFSEEILKSSDSPWFRHIGLYAYRVKTLYQYQSLPISPIEDLEKLEQLRALYNDIHIKVTAVTEGPRHGVDTIEDLELVRNIISKTMSSNKKNI